MMLMYELINKRYTLSLDEVTEKLGLHGKVTSISTQQITTGLFVGDNTTSTTSKVYIDLEESKTIS